jgi:hypothetical protein
MTDSPLPALPSVEKPEAKSLVFAEYVAVMEDASSTSTRRQTTSDIFVGLNALFVTGVGILTLASHFDSWWLAIETGVIAISVFPLNYTWFAALRNYQDLLGIRYKYLLDIETSNPTLFNGFKMNGPGGIHTQLSALRDYKKGRKGYKTSRAAEIEKRLAIYFLFLYPTITVIVAASTWLVLLGLIPPIQLIK